MTNKCFISIDKNCNLILNDTKFNENYIQVFIISKKSTKESETLIRTSEDIPVIFKIKSDGFYTICKLTIPLDDTKPYYYKNKKYYHNIQEVTLQELIEVNPEVSEIKIEYFYYFSICNLKKCFIKLCKDIFDQRLYKCKTTVDNSLIYKRDLLWSAINVIQYMTEMDYIEEAERLLEKITSCNGLCDENNKNCGCKHERMWV